MTLRSPCHRQTVPAAPLSGGRGGEKSDIGKAEPIVRRNSTPEASGQTQSPLGKANRKPNQDLRPWLRRLRNISVAQVAARGSRLLVVGLDGREAAGAVQQGVRLEIIKPRPLLAEDPCLSRP